MQNSVICWCGPKTGCIDDEASKSDQSKIIQLMQPLAVLLFYYFNIFKNFINVFVFLRFDG